MSCDMVYFPKNLIFSCLWQSTWMGLTLSPGVWCSCLKVQLSLLHQIFVLNMTADSSPPGKFLAKDHSHSQGEGTTLCPVRAECVLGTYEMCEVSKF